MFKYSTIIEEFWNNKDNLINEKANLAHLTNTVNEIIDELNKGNLTICEKKESGWVINTWLKKAILLYFKITEPQLYSSSHINWFDKIPGKFTDTTEEEFKNMRLRTVPGSFVRHGAYIGTNTIIMPSFINIGAYIGDGTMIDTWSTVGSCAYIGKNCHISGGVGIGGVLEPVSASPVIIEDNCFIGARSEVAEGIIIEEGSVLGMGVYIGASTKIVERTTGKIIYGKVPAYSVVVPGSLPNSNPSLPSLYCAVIIKSVDASTRKKTQLNELLRD